MHDAVLHMYIFSTNYGYILCPETKQYKTVEIDCSMAENQGENIFHFGVKERLVCTLCRCNLYQICLNFKIY